MEKGGLIFLIAIILSSFFISGIGNSTITGSTVTGEVTESVSLTITLSVSVELDILHPRNHTYYSSKNIPLNFTVKSQDSIWYSLDSGANTTINYIVVKFNTTEGSHTIFLYANNSINWTITSRNVTFFVNSTKSNVLYGNYSNSLKGISTDFNATSYEDAQNLTNAVLENAESGKMDFGSNIINLTDDENPEDNQLDLDSHTNFSFNRSFLNSTALGNFKK